MVHVVVDSKAGPLAASAWIERFDLPLREAGASPDGALSGLSFAAKDNIDVAGVPTTAACPAFAHTPEAHAHVVQRLLAAGAALAGKTNLDQFACGLNGTRSPYGAVPNAFDARYVSGGSSSGSAYVVATGQVDFALGTDTAGSGRVPAGLNNIVGIKPSKGLLSARGVVPAAQSVDCVSIFARTVDMATRVLLAAIEFDAKDPYARALTLTRTPFPAQFRFGVPAQLAFFGDDAAKTAFDDAIARLESLGGRRVDIDYAPLAQAADLLYDSALVSERYAAVRGFFDDYEAEVMEPVRGILARGRRYSAADYADALTQLRALAQRAAPMWRDIDVLLLPTAPTHYTIEEMLADPVVLNRNLGAYTNFVNLLDYAAIAVPASMRPDGLPFGITLVGPCASDLQLADLGQRFHHSTGLTLGATGERMPAPVAIPGVAKPATVKVAVVGAHLSGMPLNWQLTERGATLLEKTHTTPQYRLYALPGTVPPKPGLVRAPQGHGASIAVEVWEMPVAHYGSFVALIPAPLGIGTLVLADGSSVQGFACESLATEGASDITHLGGWRKYIESRQSNAA
ncbi:allophanate hydrolase [Variovorax sp. J22R133]|uniref:allophanate hydrolase n=1 Tax=Variovorax brevis TaxID=3053503 RepID=UPI002575189D|nr:allophanate hydrolase [Variovorax sp. J22R133]MDM0111481.1 allophanate hydrolase [Variovorax sp. J22R133]